ncbi:acylphosphatase [Staphylococcus pseudintermedius]|uniref:acylphosphatase n=1 Tax=Staphylococcus pseudintermedius TaxID=283734 RepID=UPI000C702FC6|nr:acylphosphatase [Staphylococcus pseudintermedius]EGQ1602556.1 acylphosphatase [Staphylococcus pseudintermedius]EGQ1694405.1 acylphosphatase [Staphylococcus pseudintermedius]EGQ1696249.1 acylphosphatase [Staphylococcus pseudintermedius]EGQ1773205.1 acylphosphatase [Staphylococcus pseudintermedius]EGQ2764678.1 acylphosphatase [Staphylococcus pseudintermedius]
MKHYLIRVYGRVQGVGFRYFTERLALKYQIKGTVKNVEDYVEVHAQGDDASLESFTQAVINGASPASRVETYTIDELEINEPYQNFRAIS